MGLPDGFSYELHGPDVRVHHRGRVAATLRGTAAQAFLADLESGKEPQLLMARVTGNYKHGNERVARQHPRNRRGR
jgi:hypothetical protein